MGQRSTIAALTDRLPQRAPGLLVALVVLSAGLGGLLPGAARADNGHAARSGATPHAPAVAPAPDEPVARSSPIPPDAGLTSVASAAPAALVVANREVIRFQGTLLGVSPADRAARAAQRIHAQLAPAGRHEVTVQPSPMGPMVQIDGATSFVVTEAEADPTQLETAEMVAARAASLLQRIATESEAMNDWPDWAGALLAVLLATLAWVLLVCLSDRLRHRVAAAALRLAQRQAERVKSGGAAWLLGERLAAAVPPLVRGLQWGLVALLSYEWLSVVLARFPYTRPWAEQLDAFLFGVVSQMAQAVVRAVPGLFTAALIFLIARFAVRLMQGFFERVEQGQLRLSWLDADLAAPTRRLGSFAIWVFALTMAYPYLPGAGTEAFKGVSVLLGLMVTLGASNLVGQAASGLILTYTRVMRPGEYVGVGESEGTVMEIGLFGTRIRTGMGEELNLPNHLVLGAVTRNYSRTVRGAGFVLSTSVSIGYDTPWREVQAMLIEAALRTPGVLAEPAPRVYQTALSDFYPQYRLVCQAVPSGPRPRAEVLDALHANIQDVFNERGVQIMSPHYMADPAEPKIAPRDAPRAG